MKRLIAVVLEILAILSVGGAGIYAAPVVASTGNVGPYEGTFSGVAIGDADSRAPLALELTHRGRQVEGSLVLDEGLYVDGGWCGEVQLPALTQEIEGQTVWGNPQRLVAHPSFDAGGFKMTIDFESNLSAGGDVIVAEAKVDLPWFCGRDPVLTSVLYRYQD